MSWESLTVPCRRCTNPRGEAPLIRRSRFAVLTESDDESDEEPLIRVAIPSRNEDDVNTVPASSSAVAAQLGPLVTTEADAGQVDEYDMTLMDADTESLSNPSAVEVEPQVPSNTSNRVRWRRLLLHWNEQVSQVTHREVRAASNMVEHLGQRIGSVPLEGDIPRIVRHQRWSPLNVPCSGQQPAIHHLAQCWSGSLRQHHRSLNHSTKDRYIRRKRHAWDGSDCDRSSDHGESHVGSNSQNGCDGKDSKPHPQGTTSVLGHRRRCSVEHVLRMRGWLCWSQFSWPCPVSEGWTRTFKRSC